MFVFEFDHNTYGDILSAFANATGGKVTNDRLNIPDHVAVGFIQRVVVDEGIDALVFDYTFSQHFRRKRSQVKKEFFSLWFNDISAIPASPSLTHKEQSLPDQPSFSSVRLTNSLFDTGLELQAGTRLKGIYIILTKGWLLKYLNISEEDEILKNYLALNNAKVTYEPLDAEYKRLMDEVIAIVRNDNRNFTILSVKSRMLQLIERFFVRMTEKKKSQNDQFFTLSKKDIQRVIEVESLLSNDVFRPAPFISELARKVNISSTKLKRDFKMVYGIPITQYFQKQRMQVAKEILQSNRFSIKKIAQELGYINQHNFSIAFKKEFGFLPSELN
ncbi:MAG: helix-turn-helix transcriptional regulator [Bacteroidota bacterium]|nr:helix-turn-helix transcriptional regulator [Bacteroidota bacterium]